LAHEEIVNRLIWCQFYQRFTYNFYTHRSQKLKKIQWSHKYLLMLSGSASVKAVRRTLMKLSPALFSRNEFWSNSWTYFGYMTSHVFDITTVIWLAVRFLIFVIGVTKCIYYWAWPNYKGLSNTKEIRRKASTKNPDL